MPIICDTPVDHGREPGRPPTWFEVVSFLVAILVTLFIAAAVANGFVDVVRDLLS